MVDEKWWKQTQSYLPIQIAMCGASSMAIDLSYVGVQMVFEILHGVIFGDGSRKFVFDKKTKHFFI
jgi:hypothetical protein